MDNRFHISQNAPSWPPVEHCTAQPLPQTPSSLKGHAMKRSLAELMAAVAVGFCMVSVANAGTWLVVKVQFLQHPGSPCEIISLAFKPTKPGSVEFRNEVAKATTFVANYNAASARSGCTARIVMEAVSDSEAVVTDEVEIVTAEE